MSPQLAYVPEKIGGHDILLVEIPRARSRILVQCGQCGRKRWTGLHEFRRLGGYPCRNCAAANRARGRPGVALGPEWRQPCRTPPGMLASSDGRISRNGHLLAQHLDRYGRLYVRPKINGKAVRFYVHILVCEAFHGAKPFPEARAAHENDICTDNREKNLSWKTRAGNTADAVRNGRTRKGRKVSAEARAKISASLAGRTQSTKTRARRSASLKRSWEQRKAR